MADKNPQKLAAARKKLKEYQKKSREIPSSVQQTEPPSSPSQQVPVLPNLPQYQPELPKPVNVDIPSGREDVRTENGSIQNYVYDSGTNHTNVEKTGVAEKLFSNDNMNINNNNNNNVLNGLSETSGTILVKNLINENSDKSNEHYVNQLVTELKTQSLFTDNFNVSDNTNNNDNSNNDNGFFDLKSAKDFFDSLPVSSQSSVDFSFDTHLTSDVPSSSITNSAAVAEVPSVVAVTNFDVKTNQDSQSDHSESVPITPSEHDKSDISTSSAEQSPKQISQVLELQLQDLDSKLGVEMNKNKILTEQLQQSHYHISQLEESLESLKKDKDAKVAALEEKLQLHVKTLEILVSEKTELQTTLTTCQEGISQKAGEIEELQSRLRASRHRVGDLERELSLAQALRQQQEKAAHEATCSRDVLKNEVDLMRKHLDESVAEVLDLKHKLEEKNNELKSFKEELQEKNSQLSLSQLRVEQLSSSGDSSEIQKQDHDLITSLQNDKKELQQQLETLSKDLKKVSSERDEASSQYQQYVTTLNSQLQSMAAKYENVCNQCDNLSAREASLVEHVASLEKQLQQTLPRKPSPPPPAVTPPSQQQNHELQQVQKQLGNITEENKRLEEQLTLQLSENAKLTEALEEYTSKVFELERSIERLEADRPDASLLQAAIESDKVAASRAIAQNTDLKKQLEELQDAFIKLSNSKLELTEKLETEQRHCEELSNQLAQHKTKTVEETELNQNNVSAVTEKIDFCSQTYNVKDTDLADVTIDLEAMAKLEDKFKKKMQEVAELSDEKQRLEHLVLQLQGETETIGEYITLYQIQRGMLRQRAQEKDEQMARLSQEREVLRNKLNELNHLVQTLLPGCENHCALTSFGAENTNAELDPTTDALKTNKNDQTDVIVQKSNEINKEETAGKIRALLTEIGSSKLVTPDGETTSFHPCPLCSGRLITV